MSIILTAGETPAAAKNKLTKNSAEQVWSGYRMLFCLNIQLKLMSKSEKFIIKK